MKSVSQNRVACARTVAFAFIAVAAWSPAVADPIKVTITVDNSYAIYHGTPTQASAFVGTDPNWPNPETYDFDLPTGSFIYVVTQSDLSTAQGFLAQFTNTATNYKFYSNDSQWQVTATGRYGFAPYSGSAVDLLELSTEVQKANAGLNPSAGWVAPTPGDFNGASPWGTQAGIDAAARWVWYDKKQDGSNPTIGSYNHDEYLIFRISVDAAPVVPEPSTWALLAMGMAGIAFARRRSRR